MKIAIIVNDEKLSLYLKDAIRQIGDWGAEFYSNPQTFGKSDIDSFNVIIAGSSLPIIDGQALLKSIHEKTNADLYLLCGSADCISKADVSHDYIKGIIKNDIASIINKLHYLETKYRIKNMMLTEDRNMNDIVVRANGYSFEIKEDIALISIKRVLSHESKSGLLHKIDESHVVKAIIQYPDKNLLHTMHCGQIFDIYKRFFAHGGKIAFCNTKNRSVDVLRECKIDKIMPVFESQEEAVKFLHT